MKTLFKNAKILDTSSERGFFMGFVGVEDSTICYVDTSPPKESYEKEIDVNFNVLMPGFVNANTNFAMSVFRGINQEEGQNGECNILEQSKITSEDVYWEQMLAITECVRNGITTIEEKVVMCKDGIKALQKSGIRARIGIGTCKESKDTYSFCEKSLNLVKQNANLNLVNFVVFANSINEFNEEQFCDLLKFANNYNFPLSINLAKTLKEVGDCTAKYNGLTPPMLLEQLGVLDRQCLCYHCVHMDKDDLQILSDYSADVVVCPSFNIKQANGIAPVFAMQNKGLNIAIGTDALKDNSIDMFKEMFLVATLSKVSLYDASVVNAKEVLDMATINGAKALGVNSGEIKVGKNADIILVNTNAPHMQPESNLISNLVYSARGSDVYLTMIGGEIKYHNGEYFIGEEIETIYKKANEIADRLYKNEQ